MSRCSKLDLVSVACRVIASPKFVHARDGNHARMRCRIVLACAALVAGCGNQHDSLVANLFIILGHGWGHVATSQRQIDDGRIGVKTMVDGNTDIGFVSLSLVIQTSRQVDSELVGQDPSPASMFLYCYFAPCKFGTHLLPLR